MPEPIPSNTMDAILARPLDLLGLTSLDQLQAIAMRAAELVDEARWLEGCALMADLSPVETHSALKARPPTYLHELHSMTMERAYRAMPKSEARDLLCEIEQEAVDAVAMRSSCDRFRRAPGHFIPGARPATSVAFLNPPDWGHDMDGWVALADGRVLPWLYGAGGVGRATVSDAEYYVESTPGVERALVVGTHVHAGVALPPEITFVCLANPVASPVNTGPEAA